MVEHLYWMAEPYSMYFIRILDYFLMRRLISVMVILFHQAPTYIVSLMCRFLSVMVIWTEETSAKPVMVIFPDIG